jgi:hypothetical protein
MEQNKTCFFISPIGSEGSPQRKRSDQIVKHILEPVLREFGLKTIRADHIQKPGLITPQVFQHILADDLTVADLSDANPNVYYELALRHAVRRPCIQLISEGQMLPFDVNQSRTIPYNLADLDNVDLTKELLRKQVGAISESSYRPESPISFAIELNFLRGSDDAQERAVGNVLLELQDLKQTVSILSRKIEHLRTKYHGNDNIRGSFCFPKEPMCEKCGKNPATAFCWFDSGGKGQWKFCCNCTDGTYSIMFDSFFSSPASTVDWIVHMNEKDYMNWTDFMAMMDRFRHATGSYGRL